MQDNQAATDSLKKYYSDEAWAELARRRAEMTPEMRAAVEDGERQWAALFADVTASLGDDPAGPNAQALLDRWATLVQSFTHGNAEVTEGLGRAWADRQNWPAPIKKQSEPFGDPRVWEFIKKASAARKR